MNFKFMYSMTNISATTGLFQLISSLNYDKNWSTNTTISFLTIDNYYSFLVLFLHFALVTGGFEFRWKTLPTGVNATVYQISV